MTTIDEILKQPKVLRLAILVGIWRGYLNYIPLSFEFIPCEEILLNIYKNSKSKFVLNGKTYIHKEYIKQGIHRRVLKLQGAVCRVCGAVISGEVHIHHIRQKRWAWGRALGFVTLCKKCHDDIHYRGLPYSTMELKNFCYVIKDASSEYYIPPATQENEGSIMTRRRIEGALNYWSLDIYQEADSLS